MRVSALKSHSSRYRYAVFSHQYLFLNVTVISSEFTVLILGMMSIFLSFRKCKWSSQCWTMINLGAMTPLERPSWVMELQESVCATGQIWSQIPDVRWPSGTLSCQKKRSMRQSKLNLVKIVPCFSVTNLPICYLLLILMLSQFRCSCIDFVSFKILKCMCLCDVQTIFDIWL